jgi:hypothetical protein
VGWAALRHRRNEDGYVQLVCWLAKSVTEKNNRRDGAGKGKKDRGCLAKYCLKSNLNILPNIWIFCPDGSYPQYCIIFYLKKAFEYRLQKKELGHHLSVRHGDEK